MSNSWSGRKVTVTGGAGFIGSNLTRRLVAEGAQVRVVDNLEKGRQENLETVARKIDFRKLDLQDPKDADRAIEGSDVVMHLAAKVAGLKVYLEHAGSILVSNQLIDQHVFAAVQHHRIPSLFYASSSHVYPEHRQQSPDAPPLKEEEALPAQPAISYGWGKLISEVTLLDLAREHPWLRVSVARICGAYGFNQDIDLETGSLIPVLCHRAVRWPNLKPFRLRGTGRETRSYCFVEDVVDALVRSVEAQQLNRIIGPLNVSAEGALSVQQIAETVIRVSGKPIPIEYDPSAPTPLWSQTVDCVKARAALGGWRPRVSLEDGIRNTYKHIEDRIQRAATS